MSRLKRAINSFISKDKDIPFPDQLKRLGLSVLADEKLEERIAIIEGFHTRLEQRMERPSGPMERLEELQSLFLELDRIIHTCAVPYGRAGAEKFFRDAIRAWEILRFLDLSKINCVRMILETKSYIDQMELVIKLEHHLLETMAHGMMILSCSYFPEDVSPRMAVVVQAPEVREYAYEDLTKGAPKKKVEYG